jgi:hypothetical protein
VLEVGSGTKFQLFLLFDIVGPFLGLTRNLGACQAFSRALKTFLIRPHLFYTPSFNTFVVATFRRVQKHLRLLVTLVEFIGEVLVAFHVAMANKTTEEEGKMRDK